MTAQNFCHDSADRPAGKAVVYGSAFRAKPAVHNFADTRMEDAYGMEVLPVLFQAPAEGDVAFPAVPAFQSLFLPHALPFLPVFLLQVEHAEWRYQKLLLQASLAFRIPHVHFRDFIKPQNIRVKIQFFQALQFYFQKLRVPFGQFSQTVIRQNVGFSLCCCQVLFQYARDFFQAFFQGRQKPSVSRYDVAFLINQYRIQKSELTK